MKKRQNFEEIMRVDWNLRATQNPKHYILCGDTDYKDINFYLTGENDVATFVDPFILKNLDQSRRFKALDIGCGLGRLTEPLSRRFKAVIGIDVSDEMILQAKKKWANKKQIEFIVGGGADLSTIPDAHVDFVFSYIVFQHIPNPEIQYQYFSDIGRVLRPGGAFLIQTSNSDPLSHEAYKQRWIAKREHFQATGDVLPFEDHDYAYLEDKIQNFETLLQQPVDREIAIQSFSNGGCEVTFQNGIGTDFFWLGGTKNI